MLAARNGFPLSQHFTALNSCVRLWPRHNRAIIGDQAHAHGWHASCTYSPRRHRAGKGVDRMSLSWIANRSLKFSPRLRLVDDAEAAALRQKIESLDFRPSNGFLRDQFEEKPQMGASRSEQAA
jgi:hypothetical protein